MRPEEVHALAVRYGLTRDQAVVATAIAWAESGLHPDAVGDEDLEDEKWGPSIGLWQVRSLRVHTGTGLERDRYQLTDPAFNARSMAVISAGGTNWRPWSMFTNGRYREHLGAVRAALAGGEDPTVPDPVAIILIATAELEEQGYKVTFVDGWEHRGRPGSFEPQGLVWHHTATSRWAAGDYPSLGLVTEGRSDLAGPLAQFGLGRSGRVYVIAAGKANHAGGGGWNGLTGNASVWGIEAENDGIGEPWPSEQIEAYITFSAALARHTGFGPEMICRHAEWSDGGKIDTATNPLNDGDWIRARVAERLDDDDTPTPEPQPEEDPDLFIFDGPDGGVYYTDGATWKRGVPGEAALEPWRQGKAHHLGTISRAYFDALPEFHPPSGGESAPAPLTGPLSGYAPEPLGCAAADQQ